MSTFLEEEARMKVYNHGCPRVKLKKNKQKSRWDFLVSFLCFQTFRKLTQSTILKCWAAVSRSWVCPWITAIKFTTRDISPYMTHFMRGWNVSQHPAEIWPSLWSLGNIASRPKKRTQASARPGLRLLPWHNVAELLRAHPLTGRPKDLSACG